MKLEESIGESMEDYLESILVLSQCIDRVRSVDVASYLGFSKPSVSHAVKLMVNQELISQETYNRHLFFTDMLTAIGVPKEVAQEDACRIEHVISKESFEAIKNYYKKTQE